jgi:nicotinate dehydrogenase subunit A
VGVELEVNGERVVVDVPPETPLLYVLRNHLGLKGAKFGCGLEQCLACAALVDGEAVPTCATGVDAFAGTSITTVEGIGAPGRLDPLQRAFVAEHAGQCGYCIPGMVVSARALLDRNADPSDEEIDAAMARNLCRCGTYSRIRAAIRRAAAEARGEAGA